MAIMPGFLMSVINTIIPKYVTAVTFSNNKLLGITVNSAMKNKLKLGVTILGLGVAVQAATLQATSLQETIATAIASHPEVHAAKNQVLSREQEVRQAKSGYLPTLDVAAGIGREWTRSPGTGKNKVWLTREEASLSASQLVFDGFATRSEVRRQKARQSSAEHAVNSTAESIALRAAEVYLAVLTQAELMSLAEASLREHKSIHDQMVLRNESGVGSRADLDQIAARLALAEGNVVVAQANLLDSITNFYRVVGVMPEVAELTQPKLSGDLPASLEAAVEQAIEVHPTLGTANADVRATVAQYEASESPFWPDVRVEVDRAWNEDIDGVRGGNEDQVVALRMRYNLYRGGGDRARRKQTSYLIEEAKDVRNNTRRQVIEGIRLSWSAFQSINAQMPYLKKHVNAASSTKEAYVKQFNIGRRTLLDLLNTENEVVDSKRSLIRAQADEILAEYRVYNSMGLLLPKLGVTQ